MNLAEIKHIAETFPEQIEICWVKIESDPKYRKDFEKVVTKALEFLPELENIHTRLTTGKHAVYDTQFTTLNPAMVEEYLDKVEEELFAGYQMQEMWNRYQAVMNLVNSI
jgi:hypothetical protein